MSYCIIARGHPFHEPYHDREYGFPIAAGEGSDDRLFERLMLEVNQAGLSWLTILKKRDEFHRAYDGFVLERVAAYGERDRERLLDNPGIVRNRLKVGAAIENAKRILAIRHSHGSFTNWLDAHHPLAKEEWCRLFKKTFVFTGGEITHSFLMSVGYLPGAHDDTCPVYETVAASSPRWMQS
jgi:DNA-3-methyladenine glycosylase I